MVSGVLFEQTEEHYISVETISQQMPNLKVSALLKSELALLKGLNYDLIIHSSFMEIDGFLEVQEILIIPK